MYLYSNVLAQWKIKLILHLVTELWRDACLTMQYPENISVDSCSFSYFNSKVSRELFACFLLINLVEMRYNALCNIEIYFYLHEGGN